ncbi:MAG: response regulator [Anaerolineales bacterium]|nr:response regulator [Anaerolineales bacterium]
MASGEQILIVESDPDIADLIGRQSLQPLGYQVTVEHDAASALKRAVQTPPDLILANINLPGLSGKDLLTALSSQGVESPLIVVRKNEHEFSRDTQTLPAAMADYASVSLVNVPCVGAKC